MPKAYIKNMKLANANNKRLFQTMCSNDLAFTHFVMAIIDDSVKQNAPMKPIVINSQII
ncbi:hypothetical protein FACS1894152_2700 [Bacilli bacterium]|nr:hypothetical protein FACS1894152_2700 [Bacilli bacterium]